MLLVDYKYRGNILQPILKAVSKIVKKSHNYGIITLSSSFSDVDRALKRNRYIKFGSNGQIVTNVNINLSKQQIKQRKSIFVTVADSNADFFMVIRNGMNYEL